MHFKHFKSTGRYVRHLEYSVNKTMPLMQIKINVVRGTVIYNAHTKFELNQKHRLDTNILIII